METREEWTVIYTRNDGERFEHGSMTRAQAEMQIKISTWNEALGKYQNHVWLNGEPMFRLVRRVVVIPDWEVVPFDVDSL